MFLFFLCLFVFFFVAKSRSAIFCNQCVIPPFRKNAKAMLAMAEITLPLYIFFEGAKEVSFTACHSGKQ